MGVGILMANTILFIHGMFMNGLCWENWVERFSQAGYKCLAPSWKFHQGTPADLRAHHPNPALGRLTLDDVVSQYTDIIRGLDHKPILIGHSMGGLVTQILLNRDLGIGGAALDSAPPRGVFTLAWSFFKANFPLINPLVSADLPHAMSLAQFQYAFVNDMPEAEQKAAYERYAIPESRHVGRGGFSAVAQLDYPKTRVPLLLTAGSNDHIIPPSLNHANYSQYHGASNVTLQEFAGRNHFLIGQTGWQEVADSVLQWMQKQGL